MRIKRRPIVFSTLWRDAMWVAVFALTACGHAPEILQRPGEIFHPGNIKLIYVGPLKDNPEVFKVEVDDLPLYVFGKAVRPSIQSVFLLENTVINAGEDVLDLGTGSGVQAIFAAQKARRVVATDIGEDAVKSAQYNVKLHGLEGKIDVRLGDLFAPLKEGEMFDVIINNIDYPPQNEPEHALWEVHHRFFKEVKKYLKHTGRIIYQSGFFYNIPQVEQMTYANGLQIMEMKMKAAVFYGKDMIVYSIQREYVPSSSE